MKTILVVEDNEEVGGFINNRLKEEGFEVHVLKDGYELLSYLVKNTEPDAVILDLFIPGIGGIELLGSINRKWKNSKIFIYSAQTDYKPLLMRQPSVCGFHEKTEGIENLVAAVKKKLRG